MNYQFTQELTSLLPRNYPVCPGTTQSIQEPPSLARNYPVYPGTISLPTNYQSTQELPVYPGTTQLPSLFSFADYYSFFPTVKQRVFTSVLSV